MNILGIIPSRMASSRFPGKPMHKIMDVPMIGHCYLRSKLCNDLDALYVATCDKEIHDYIIDDLQGKSVITSLDHERAAERCAEALIKIEKIEKKTFSIIIMIQGDEPLIIPDLISKLIYPFKSLNNFSCVNLMSELPNFDEASNKNNVKVVVNDENRAIYFSREPIPSKSKFNKNINYKKQLGLMSFTRDSLLFFINNKPSVLEIIESVDLNRMIEYRGEILMVDCDFQGVAVDNPDDIFLAELQMSKDVIFLQGYTQ
jgi:3-deoxy-manno-octulosonate cytidylyltransferase (CMP-KDO synthetase)